MRKSLVILLMVFCIGTAAAVSHAQSAIEAEEFLNWENRTDPYIADAPDADPLTSGIPDSPLPTPKPAPSRITRQKSEPVQLSGNAGPAMPAVPTGAVKVEIIEENKSVTTPASASETEIVMDTMMNIPPRMTLIFNESGRLDLDPYQRNMLKNEISSMLREGYQGRIRVYSYANTQENEPVRTHQMAISRAIRVRNTLLKYGLKEEQLDVRAVNNPSKGNVINIYLSAMPS